MNSFRSILPLVALFALTLFRTGMAAAPVANAVIVEEAWQLTLNEPNVMGTSPQFSTYFPLNSNSYFVTTFNCFDRPNFSPGGIQIQLWTNDECVQTVDVPLVALNVSGDTITWRMVYQTDGTSASAKIVGLTAKAWGQNINPTTLVANGANVANFNNYDVTKSLGDSHVGCGKNRVDWFGITKVRKLDDKGKEISVDTTLRKVQ